MPILEIFRKNHNVIDYFVTLRSPNLKNDKDMTDYDDAMNDYDWYQNTGENREYFEDGNTSYSRQPQQAYHRNKDTKRFDETDADCLTLILVIAAIVGIIAALVIWLF